MVQRYDNLEHGAGNQGLLVLGALWRSVEKLSGDLGLEERSYQASLKELESRKSTANTENSYSSVGAYSPSRWDPFIGVLSHAVHGFVSVSVVLFTFECTLIHFD